MCKFIYLFSLFALRKYVDALLIPPPSYHDILIYFQNLDPHAISQSNILVTTFLPAQFPLSPFIQVNGDDLRNYARSVTTMLEEDAAKVVDTVEVDAFEAIDVLKDATLPTNTVIYLDKFNLEHENFMNPSIIPRQSL